MGVRGWDGLILCRRFRAAAEPFPQAPQGRLHSAATSEENTHGPAPCPYRPRGPAFARSALRPSQLKSTSLICPAAPVASKYDEAIAFYVGTLGFELVEDSYQPEQDKRWVIVRPKGNGTASLLLARASTDHQADYIGDQAGGRVFVFLQTDDFWRDYEVLKGKGVEFVREPKEAGYGKVAVFSDLCGTPWDLVEFGLGGRG
ncbi:MAG: VOC family protein [Rhizobium sp.]|nr:VOC family protein [Rhizobium sp.]